MGSETEILSVAGGGENLWPLLTYAFFVGLVLVGAIGGSWLLGARTKARKATDMPFESGIVPVGEAERIRLSIEFYLIAMFFVIFDLETIFIFGWAVAFFELGWRGYVGAAVFILILLVALVYEWRSGALDWGLKQRLVRRDYARSPSVRAAASEGA